MTYEIERAVIGRRPITFLELDLDHCTNTYGGGLLSPQNGTCTAALSPGSECYNTRKTCQDTANYIKGISTCRFCEPRSDLPTGVNVFPVISGKINQTPVGAPVYGVGDRGKVTVTLKDFPHDDSCVDPYYLTRSYDPLTQGTYFGKLKARSPYYIGRVFRIRTGYLTDPFSWDNFQNRTYVIDKIDGPDSKGNVKITGSDFLKLTDNDTAKVPIQSTGTYVSGLTDSPMTIKVTALTADYDASGYVRIGDEIYQYAGKSLDSPETGIVTLTGITRGTWGSVQDLPEADDTVQMCKSWTSINVVDIVYWLLNTGAGIDVSKIPYSQGSPEDEWDFEKVTWLSGNNLTTIISEPTGVRELLEELCEQNQFSLFVDQINDKVKLITNTPPTKNAQVLVINDDASLLKDSVAVKEDTKRQATRVTILYAPRDYTKDEDTNYRIGFLSPDLIAEGPDLYDTVKEKRIKSRWFDDTNGPQVSQLAGRLISRFTDPPKVLHFTLDAKDSDLWTGDLAEITTRMVQNQDGSDFTLRFQILSVDERADQLKYVAMASQFRGLYAYIAPNGLGDYSFESAENKQSYAFICENTGLFDNGDPGYKII